MKAKQIRITDGSIFQDAQFGYSPGGIIVISMNGDRSFYPPYMVKSIELYPEKRPQRVKAIVRDNLLTNRRGQHIKGSVSARKENK